MASHYIAERTDVPCSGLILFSFPLHVAKKPATKRAAHLHGIKVPMLYVSGDRDTLADKPLLEQVIHDLPLARVHWLETADHSFRILKRTRQSSEDVYAEVARIVSAWIAER